MRKYEYRENGVLYCRISKKAAKKAYITGETVVLCPVNLVPWRFGIPINRTSRERFTADEIGAKNDFNNYVNSFEFYNCVNTETGKYTAFYVGGVNNVQG